VAKLDVLIEQVPDPELRAELRDAVCDLRRRTAFGLVFEEHIPEITLLRGVPVKVGATVFRREDTSSKNPLTVTHVNNGKATVVTATGQEMQEAVERLLVLRRFGDPIYPTLTPIDTIQRGDGRPSHAVIDGENYHVLQLLRFMYEGQVDCIYIDPPYNTGARAGTRQSRSCGQK
jgi:adenine-specific DNA-methyltransferase